MGLNEMIAGPFSTLLGLVWVSTQLNTVLNDSSAEMYSYDYNYQTFFPIKIFVLTIPTSTGIRYLLEP